MTRPPRREEQRDRLLEAALVHVPFDGWSRRSLLAGAADAGLEPGLARRLFPRLGDDLLAHLDRWADRQMLARAGDHLGDLRMRDRIAALVRARLEALAPTAKRCAGRPRRGCSPATRSRPAAASGARST